jgi:PST family polysaccharide transporter
MLRGTAWTTVEEGARTIFALATFIVMARLLGPATVGVAVMAMMAINFSEKFLAETVVESVVQLEELTDGHLNAAFIMILGIGGLCAAIMFVAAPFAATAFGEPQVEALIYALIPAVLAIALTSVPSVLCRRHFNFSTLAKRTSLSLFIGGGAGIGLAFAGAGVWAMIVQQVIGRIVAAIIVWRAVDWRPGVRFTRGEMRDVFSYALPSMHIGAISAIQTLMLPAFVAHFYGSVALGYFHIGFRLLGLMRSALIAPISRVSVSAFARLQDTPKRLEDALIRLLRNALIVAVPAHVGIALVSPNLIVVLFGAAWAEATPVVVPLVLSGVFGLLVSVEMSLLRALNHPGAHAMNATLTLLATALGLGVVAWMGFDGFAWVVFAKALLVSFPLAIVATSRIAGISIRRQLSVLLVPMAGSTVMALAVIGLNIQWPVGEAVVLHLAADILLGVVTYGLTVLVLDRSTPREIVGSLRSLVRPNATIQRNRPI